MSAEQQLRALIDLAIEPEIPHRRLVLQLTGRIADPQVQGDLNESLNTAIDELRLDDALGQGNGDTRVHAHQLLDRIISAGRQ